MILNNLNVANLIMRNQTQILRKIDDKSIKVSIFKFQIMRKTQNNLFSAFLEIAHDLQHNYEF